MIDKLDIEKNYQKYLRTAIFVTVLFKLLLMGLFSSDYQDRMFIPFVRCFLDGNNPYQFYYDNQLLSSFPYPPVMLMLECIGGVLISFSDAMPVFLQNLLFKMPILLMDLLGLYFLMKISKSKRKYILVLYFLSPTILYAAYMHGQLDLIPTVFLIGAIYYLTQNEIVHGEWKFVFFLTMALSSKFHIAAVLPLFFLYLYKKRGQKKAVLFTAIPIFATMVLILPFWGSGFAKMVLLNKEQNVISNVYLDYHHAHLLLVILVLLFVYFQAFRLNQMNRDLLISMSGLLFSVFLAFVPAMPGWFIWVVPFFMLYLAGLQENRAKMVLVYCVFQLLYLVYYVFFHVTEFVDLSCLKYELTGLKIHDEGLQNILFTLMIGIFMILVVSMYSYGVNSNSYYRRRNRPFTIGIAGDSGVGKSRLLLMLDELLSEEHILNIEGDGDHKWERGSAKWQDMTHLDPKANYLYRQAEDLKVLRCGNAVKRVDYDHQTGTFTRRHKVSPKPYIIMCGLHSLYLPQMRQVLDMKIYLDTEESLRCYWKMERDAGDRGHSRQEIMEQIAKRREDAAKYIYPQRKYADLIIHYFDKNMEETSGDMPNGYQPQLSVEFVMDVGINVEPLLSVLQESSIQVQSSYNDDLLHQQIVVESNVSGVTGEMWRKMAEQTIPQMEDLTGARILWEDGINGIVQLMILLVMGEIMKG